MLLYKNDQRNFALVIHTFLMMWSVLTRAFTKILVNGDNHSQPFGFQSKYQLPMTAQF